MEREINKIENSLMIPEKENIFTRFFKWVSNKFGKKPKEVWTENQVKAPIQNITIPKSVKMPMKVEEIEDQEENSLEYLYKLSDEELDDLDKLYDQQLEEAQNEILRLDNILQTYKQSIKKLQNQIPEEDV